MFKFILFSTFIAVTMAGLIHEHHGGDSGDISETEHHSHVDHKHAQSHQSVKFIHYHAVPVYVKKEDQKYIHHPVEIGSNKHKLKLVHPETEHSKGHGLAIENHSEFKSHKIEYPHHDTHHHASESYEVHQENPEYEYTGYEGAHH
ncbi:hypothetical protein PVAND_010272 [Polypedilum vanderplanki]|uniref:Histidine-rich glycoprotein n=1 Tax=Polypedilum vanderplanki TaxID=319348 RepID=A0A9J6CF76_POLVA|nr:hypothetical protein PVAND_010272 [Polypedilum vanderplanki]